MSSARLARRVVGAGRAPVADLGDVDRAFEVDRWAGRAGRGAGVPSTAGPARPAASSLSQAAVSRARALRVEFFGEPATDPRRAGLALGTRRHSRRARNVDEVHDGLQCGQRNFGLRRTDQPEDGLGGAYPRSGPAGPRTRGRSAPRPGPSVGQPRASMLPRPRRRRTSSASSTCRHRSVIDADLGQPRVPVRVEQRAAVGGQPQSRRAAPHRAARQRWPAAGDQAASARSSTSSVSRSASARSWSKRVWIA